MKKCFLTVAVSVFLFSCTDIQRDNPYDILASNYIEDIPKEGSSSSVAAGEPFSSSGNEKPSSGSAGVSSSSGEALSSSSSASVSSSSGGALSSSSVETGNSSSSSSGENPSSGSGVPEPINAGEPLSFTNANYTEDGKKYYWLGATPVVKKNWVIQNRTSAKCDGDIWYEQSPEVWDSYNPGKISICVKTVCDEKVKILECAEAEFVDGTMMVDERDGQPYKIVKIGTQTWMAENLNYNPGTTGNSVCYDNCTTYGRLYSWYTATTVCPSSWHLPSNAEWDVLVETVGGSSTAGIKLKAKSGWDIMCGRSDDSSCGGEDTYGFSALPGGYAWSDGDFGNVYTAGFWWSSDAANGYLQFQYMSFSGDNVSRSGGSQFCSVRCVKD
jgi:uncharacterized protein (TIGR02145 family)